MNSGGGGEAEPKTDPVLREIRSIGSIVRETKEKVESMDSGVSQVGKDVSTIKDGFETFKKSFEEFRSLMFNDLIFVKDAISGALREMNAAISARRIRRKRKDAAKVV